MTANDINSLLRRQPFVPFLIVTSDGTSYQVSHPELCMVGLGSAIVGYPAPGLQHTYERYDIVSMRHIVRLEPGDQPAPQQPQQGNGQP